MTTTRIEDIHDLTELSFAAGVKAELIEAYLNAPRQVDYYQIIKIAKRGRNRRGNTGRYTRRKINGLRNSTDLLR